MTDIDIKKEMESLVNHVATADAMYKLLRDLFGASPESPFVACLHDMLGGYIALLSKAAGDDTEMIYWFVHENDCGAKGMEAGFDGDMRKIRTVDDLMWLLGK